ncbi:MAG: hypothetical protein IT342_21855 [Candidatus Melainabacteria bacterium]|nr:hypothetical protein [Candidatus Melainabacteria bacterium]
MAEYDNERKAQSLARFGDESHTWDEIIAHQIENARWTRSLKCFGDEFHSWEDIEKHDVDLAREKQTS